MGFHELLPLTTLVLFMLSAVGLFVERGVVIATKYSDSDTDASFFFFGHVVVLIKDGSRRVPSLRPRSV
jgi:hypothetical protein